ncbi:glycosyltransferase family 4 protein [Croceicoccus sp. BE223]|uniref:glycosyltransferase family 4 protein n=1 Tax=Croceicoccus sp. BE223 TaxID=2817716 RepID=UPI00286726CB|nr:glycosyltransferase family 4 protein [Croceicoccus sp. BE223]MDR7104038.1 glycosyltransferase involved in cell wall biosynthesis [Croceicoccus sp. BE223]
MDEARILFVTRKWAPAVGGMETYSMRLAEAMQAIEPVEVVALPGKPHGMPPGALALLAFPFRVIAALLRRRRMPEVLHLGDMAIWPLALLPRLFFADTRIALSAHGTDVAYHRRGGVKGRAYGAYLRLGARLLRGARVIANSRATRDVLGETGWTACAVVPLATDLSGPATDGRHNGRILFVGRLVARKGCGWFVREVLPLLPEAMELDVAGTGWDEAESEVLRHPRVNWLGALEGEALARAYAEALCVIVPNIPIANGEYEGFGLVAPEAAACGGMVLAADLDGLRDAVVHGETGVLICAANSGAWSEKILSIIQTPIAIRAARLAQSQATARTSFNWSTVAHNTHAAYGFETSHSTLSDRDR